MLLIEQTHSFLLLFSYAAVCGHVELRAILSVSRRETCLDACPLSHRFPLAPFWFYRFEIRSSSETQFSCVPALMLRVPALRTATLSRLDRLPDVIPERRVPEMS